MYAHTGHGSPKSMVLLVSSWRVALAPLILLLIISLCVTDGDSKKTITRALDLQTGRGSIHRLGAMNFPERKRWTNFVWAHIRDIFGHGHVPRRMILAKLINKYSHPSPLTPDSLPRFTHTSLRYMRTCYRFQHCPELRAERETKAPAHGRHRYVPVLPLTTRYHGSKRPQDPPCSG